MKYSAAHVMLLTVFSMVLGAQEPPPVAAPAQPPVVAAAPVPVLENNGKPIVVPFQCSLEDVQWAGLSCSEDDPCPMFLELASLHTEGMRILVAGNVHSSAVTLASVLLGSEDGGRTWREVHPHIRGAALDRVQFLDAENGWASGESISPLPQDPFVLVTSDGGKNWRQRPIFGESRESRFGSVQQFGFTAKDSGSLIVDRGQGADGDRYELYESPDGGDSWTVSETSSKPLKLKRPPPAPPTDWRLRADGPTQAFRIEHRVGERWVSVAAFAVKLAGCKPTP